MSLMADSTPPIIVSPTASPTHSRSARRELRRSSLSMASGVPANIGRPRLRSLLGQPLNVPAIARLLGGRALSICARRSWFAEPNTETEQGQLAGLIGTTRGVDRAPRVRAPRAPLLTPISLAIASGALPHLLSGSEQPKDSTMPKSPALSAREYALTQAKRSGLCSARIAGYRAGVEGGWFVDIERVLSLPASA